MTNTCDICEKKFTRKTSLNRHKSKFHLNTSMDQFKCHLCENNFNSSNDLVLHLANNHDQVNSVFTKLDHSFGNTIKIYRKSLVSEKTNVHHFCNSKSTINEIFKVISEEFEEQPAFKVSIAVSANYSINDTANGQKKDSEIIVLRGKGDNFVKFDKSSTNKRKIRRLLDQIVSREEEFNESGSNWQFDQLISCDVLIYKVNSIPTNKLQNILKK